MSKPRAGTAQEDRRPVGIRRLRRWALLAVVALTLGTATAQGQTFGTMAFSTTHTYDDNLFATPTSRGRDEDFISRFGPTIEAGHRSLPLTLVGRYAVDAERYWQHAGLNRHVARQDGTVQVDYRSTRRLALYGRASYVETQSPLEFNVDSRLALGRVHAERVTAASASTYALDAVTRLTSEYEFAREGLADQPGRSRGYRHAPPERQRHVPAVAPGHAHMTLRAALRPESIGPESLLLQRVQIRPRHGAVVFGFNTGTQPNSVVGIRVKK